MPRDLLEGTRPMKKAELQDLLFGKPEGEKPAPRQLRSMTVADWTDKKPKPGLVMGSGLPAANEAIGNMLGLPVDVVNQVLKAVGLGSDEPFGGSTMVKRGMENLGVDVTPQQDTEGQRLAADVGRGVGAGAMFGPGAVIPSAVGGLTGGVAREAGGGPVVQTLAGMAGGMAAGGVQNMAAKAVSGTPSPKLQAYQREGVTPRMSAASEGLGSRAAQQTVAGLRDAPITGGMVQRAAQEATDDLKMAIERRASTFGPAVSKTDAGEAVQRGVQTFVRDVSQRGEKLYGALNRAMPPTTMVPTTNTIQAVGSLNQALDDLPGTASILTPRLFAQIKDDLAAGSGQVKFSTLQRLRTEVGQKLSDPHLMDDIGRRDLKLLYGAVTEDMKAAVKGTNAEPLFNIANEFWRKNMEFVEKSFARMQSAGASPEAIFNWATAEGKSGATRLAALRKAMGDAEFGNVSAVVTRQLGKLGSDTGQFSPARFVTNWGNLSADAKKVLYDPDYRESMDRLVSIAKDFSKAGELANTSRTAGTSQLFSWVTGIAQGAVGIGAGIPAMGGTIGLQVVGQATASKLLTSPGFTKWLATEVGPNGIGAHLKILPQIAMREPQIAGEIEEFLKGVAAVGDIQE